MFKRNQRTTSSEYEELNKRFIDLLTHVKELEVDLSAMDTKVRLLQKKMNKKIFPDLGETESNPHDSVILPTK